jgi:hypothetical protein
VCIVVCLFVCVCVCVCVCAWLHSYSCDGHCVCIMTFPGVAFRHSVVAHGHMMTLVDSCGAVGAIGDPFEEAPVGHFTIDVQSSESMTVATVRSPYRTCTRPVTHVPSALVRSAGIFHLLYFEFARHSCLCLLPSTLHRTH